MPIFETSNLFACLAMILLGLGISLFIGKKLGLSASRSAIIYLWHSLFCAVYIFLLSRSNGGDAIYYYIKARSGVLEMGLGSEFVVLVTAFGVKVLNLDFYSMNFMYHIFGAIGLMFLDSTIKNITTSDNIQKTIIEKYIIFLPSLSFWSAGLGKDSLAIMCIGVVLWAAQFLGKRFILMLSAMLILFFVRPHVAVVCGMALSSLVFFDRRISIITRLSLIPLISIVLVFFLPRAAQFTGLGADFNSSDLQNYISQRASVTSIGGSAVDISSMNPIQRVLNYILRPILPEARSPVQFVSGVDNTVVLILLFGTILTYFKTPKGLHMVRRHSEIFLLTFFMIMWFMLGLTTANLGIAQRQKWMFLPALILLYITRKRKQKLYRFSSPYTNFQTPI